MSATNPIGGSGCPPAAISNAHSRAGPTPAADGGITRCIVSGIVPLTPVEAAALPKAARP